MRRILTMALAALLAIALLAAPVSARGAKAPSDATIVDIALQVNADMDEFNTLIAALVAADLVDALDNGGQFTVFAPTDAAFAAIGLDADNVGDVEGLADILLYHVTEGRRFSNSVFNKNNSKPIEMLNGGYVWSNPDLSITDSNAGTVDAGIVDPLFDISASNGVIHVIDQVLLP
jgi:uncharacterized surface protein with fasciclin (FAS1) repeats